MPAVKWSRLPVPTRGVRTVSFDLVMHVCMRVLWGVMLQGAQRADIQTQARGGKAGPATVQT